MTFTASRRFDIAALRERVSVGDVLRSFGHEPPPRGGRMPCPIHSGGNATAFSFDEGRFHCFACGAGGDVIDLAQRLHGMAWRDAVAHLSRLAGLAVTPSVAPAAVAQRQTRSERRRALVQWCGDRVNALGDVLRSLDADIERMQIILNANPENDGAWAKLADFYQRGDMMEHAFGTLRVAEARRDLATIAQWWGGGDEHAAR